MTFYDADNPQIGGPTTGSSISAFTQIRRKGRLLGFLFLVLALGAALLVAVDSEPRPAFADLSGLPTDTAFSCGDNEGRGGYPYQHSWGFDTGSVFDAAIADAAGVQNGSMMLQLAIYNTLTGNYDVQATYAPSVTGGLVDENGQVLIAPSDFSKSNYKQVNGLLMDPLGNMYIAVQPNKDKQKSYLVQLIPPASQNDPSTSWDDTKLGTMRPIAKLQTSKGTGAEKINAATYFEDANGNPYASLTGSFFKSDYWNVPLDATGIPEITGTSKTGSGGPKDFSWVKEGISYNGQIYDLVALEQTGTTSGAVHLQQADGDNYAKISGLSMPNNSRGSKETFGASYNFKFEDNRTYVYFSANFEGYFVELGLPDLDNAGNIPITGANSFDVKELQGSLKTNDNDGAGCPYEPPPSIEDLTASTWPPICNNDDPNGVGSEVPIRVINQGAGATQVRITATIDGVTVPASDYRSSHSSTGLSDLDGNGLFPVPGATVGTAAGFLELMIDIEKDEVWQATVTRTDGTVVQMVPDGGTLSEPPCDFIDAATWSPNLTFGNCTVNNDGTNAVAATLDNTASTTDANTFINVNGTLFETFTVAAGATQNVSIAPVINGDSLNIQMSDSSGNGNPFSSTVTADCPSSIDSWDCAVNSGLVQTREDTAAGIVTTGVLNPTDGTISPIWILSNTAAGSGDNEFDRLNATDLHPTSEVAYGLLSFANNGGFNGGVEQTYFIRFDSDNIEFVYEIDTKAGDVRGIAFDGAFTSTGDFYYTPDDDNLYRLPNPDGVTGYSDRSNASLPADPSVLITAFEAAGDITSADIDLGNGIATYIFALHAIANGDYFNVYDVAANQAYDFETIQMADGTPVTSTTFGGHYRVTDAAGTSIFFSGNTSGEILKLDLSSVNLNDLNQTVVFNNAGSMELTSANDGMNCPVTVKEIPEEFGDVFGYVWVDFNDDGLRTSIEDGSEPHVTGYDVTIRNATQYKDSLGNVVHEPGQMEYSGVMSGTDTGDYRWQANLPCKDNNNNTLEWVASFDYTNVSNWPTGFTPNGYTTETNDSVTTSELDSDGAQSGAELLLSNSFTVTCGATIQSTTHRADAGVIGDFVFAPTVTVDVNCATAVTVDLDNSGSNIDSTFIVNVYRVSSGTATLQSSESATQLVAAGATTQYATAITLPSVTEILYLVIEGQGTLNGATNSGRYSQEVLNQSANDGVNFLCVQVQAEMDCASGGEQVALDNTASNQDATFIVTPVVDGVDQAPVTQVVSAGATVVLTNTELSIPEDSTWTIKWSATGATAGSFSETTLDTDLEKDCIEPVFDPVVTYAYACAADGVIQITITVDNTASTQYDMSVDPLADRHTTHVTPLRYGTSYMGIDIKATPGQTAQGTVSYQEGQWVDIWVQQTRPWDPTAEGIDGGWFLEEILYPPSGSCPDWNPVATLSFECGVSGTGLLTTNINNAASEVEMRYKLVATDFDGNTTVVNDWQTVPAGQDRIVTLSQLVDQNLEYSIVAESTEAHPAAFGPGAVTAPSGWGSYSVALYADCVVEDTWSPFAELSAECASGNEEIFLQLDNTRSTFSAEFTVDVYDGTTTDAPKNEAASSTQSIPSGALEFYSTTIPLPSPGDGIYVQVTVLPITTGGESLAEESEINLTQLINCPESLVLDISMGFICGTTVQGLIINNELSSQSVTIKATQYLSPDSSSGPWKLGEVYSDVPSVKTIEIAEGEEQQFIFYAISDYYWKIDWELTEINGESVDNIEEDITTVGTLRSEEKVTSQDDSSCPGTPLFTG